MYILIMTLYNHDFFHYSLKLFHLYKGFFFKSLNITEKTAVREKYPTLSIWNSGNYCSLKYIHVHACIQMSSYSTNTILYMMDNNKFWMLLIWIYYKLISKDYAINTSNIHVCTSLKCKLNMKKHQNNKIKQK